MLQLIENIDQPGFNSNELSEVHPTLMSDKVPLKSFSNIKETEHPVSLSLFW